MTGVKCIRDAEELTFEHFSQISFISFKIRNACSPSIASVEENVSDAFLMMSATWIWRTERRAFKIHQMILLRQRLPVRRRTPVVMQRLHPEKSSVDAVLSLQESQRRVYETRWKRRIFLLGNFIVKADQKTITWCRAEITESDILIPFKIYIASLLWKLV